LIVGEIDGRETARVAALSELLGPRRIRDHPLHAHRAAVWYKLWGNLTMNPCRRSPARPPIACSPDPLVRRFCAAAMDEAAAIGARIGCEMKETAEQRQAVARKLGAFKTSMLQVVEAGRPARDRCDHRRSAGSRLKVGVARPNIGWSARPSRLFRARPGVCIRYAACVDLRVQTGPSGSQPGGTRPAHDNRARFGCATARHRVRSEGAHDEKLGPNAARERAAELPEWRYDELTGAITRKFSSAISRRRLPS
jgi:hypothetical protein